MDTPQANSGYALVDTSRLLWLAAFLLMASLASLNYKLAPAGYDPHTNVNYNAIEFTVLLTHSILIDIFVGLFDCI